MTCSELFQLAGKFKGRRGKWISPGIGVSVGRGERILKELAGQISDGSVGNSSYGTLASLR